MKLPDTLTLEEKKNFLLYINAVREKIRSYKFVHVLSDNKFTKSIVEFINSHFPTSEHCFVYMGNPKYPHPTGENILCCPVLDCLTVSDMVEKVIFHGLYDWRKIAYLYEHPEIMQKSYWIPWGGDLFEAPDEPIHNHVRRNFQGYMVDAYFQNACEQRYGKDKVFFPLSISYESIPYKTIISTPIPKKNYIQIQVNNSTHKTTLEAFEYLQKFSRENIRIVTILSYGKQEWRDKILAAGQKIFGGKFFPIMNYMPPDTYIKHLARNDIYIMNQHRPQGLTTAFTSMLLGQKIFMRGSINDFLLNDGYVSYDTATIPQLSFEELLKNPAKEENRRLAVQRFDEQHVKQTWANIFEYK